MSHVVPNRFKLVPISNMVLTEPDYLVDEVFERGVMAVAFGDPGAGKSFLALDLAACVATGTPFHGKATKRGPAIYVAGEGHSGLARRRAAWEKHTKVVLDDAPLFVSTVAGNFLDNDVTMSVVAAIKAIADNHGDPALIVVDTLARNFGEGDENSSEHMNRFTAAIDFVKGLWPGCTALIVHHTGHGNKGRARGSMALKGNADTEYSIEKKGMSMTLECTKMKDGSPPALITFELVEVFLGLDQLERPITSLALKLTDANPKRRTVRSGQEPITIDSLGANPKRKIVLKGQVAIAAQAFADALEKHGEVRKGDIFPQDRPCITLEQWRKLCDRHELSAGKTATARRTAFHRVKTKLQEYGIIRIVDGWAWLEEE